MKKKIFSFLVCGLATTMAFATDIAECSQSVDGLEVTPAPSEKVNLGRECCEKAGRDDDGNLVIVEACAGWFLSNSDAAHERACDKANAALKSIIGDNF